MTSSGPRRSGLTAVAACLLTLALPAAAGCEPIEGVAKLLEPGRVLLLGELHGTVESPAFAGDVACHAAAAGLDVIVGFELLPEAATGFETFLKSQGEPADRDALLAGAQWQRGYQDGRTSEAMVELLAGLARLRREGHSVRVVLFDAQPPGGGQPRERAMAAHLAASVEASPEALSVVLTGNAHSRVTRGNRRSPDYEPMGYLLGRAIGAERITSLDVSHAGGSAWICAPGCGAVGLRGHGSAETRWRVEIDEATRPAGHHGFYGVGTIGASPPAAGDHGPMESMVTTTPASPGPAEVEEFPAQTPQLLRPLQGSWEAYQYGSKAWTIDIEGRRFRGVLGPDDWYEGQIRIRRDTDPAQIDFMIEDCRCAYRDMTSQAIFDDSGASILLAAPQPGTARPRVFKQNDGRTVELRRVEAPAKR